MNITRSWWLNGSIGLRGTRLADVARGRDNNFNLLRLIAATAVLISHSFPLAIGPKATEPLVDAVGMTLGGVAVDVFFVTSGYLVTASLINRRSTLEFVWARTLRIFPGLVVMLMVVAFVAGPLLTTLHLAQYFASTRVYMFLAECSTLFRCHDQLPGVFTDNPFKETINGSLWTLPHELKMYALLALAWLLLAVAQKLRLQALHCAIVVGAVAAGVDQLALHLRGLPVRPFIHFAYLFFGGAACYVLRDRFVLSGTLFWTLLVALLVTAVDKEVFYIAYMLLLPYLLIYAAYAQWPVIRLYNKLGDYSYGIYIYAFPVQQSAAHFFPGISVL